MIKKKLILFCFAKSKLENIEWQLRARGTVFVYIRGQGSWPPARAPRLPYFAKKKNLPAFCVKIRRVSSKMAMPQEVRMKGV